MWIGCLDRRGEYQERVQYKADKIQTKDGGTLSVWWAEPTTEYKNKVVVVLPGMGHDAEFGIVKATVRRF